MLIGASALTFSLATAAPAFAATAYAMPENPLPGDATEDDHRGWDPGTWSSWHEPHDRRGDHGRGDHEWSRSADRHRNDHGWNGARAWRDEAIDTDHRVPATVEPAAESAPTPAESAPAPSVTVNPVTVNPAPADLAPAESLRAAPDPATVTSPAEPPPDAPAPSEPKPAVAAPVEAPDVSAPPPSYLSPLAGPGPAPTLALSSATEPSGPLAMLALLGGLCVIGAAAVGRIAQPDAAAQFRRDVKQALRTRRPTA